MVICKVWWYNLDFFNAFIILGCIFAFWIIGKVFSIPLKAIGKLILNSILGGVLIFIINLVGQLFSFHIGLNVVTSLLVGILGIPGAILLIILKIFI